MARIKLKDNTKLYYKDWGKGRPVILIHGWPLSADSWDDQAMAIAEAGFRAIAYDRRGFGRSEQTFTGYDYDTLSDDLAAVMEATGAHQDATLVGFSMGGGEVARYMSRHQGRGVVQAALVSSIVPFMEKTDSNPDGVDRGVLSHMLQGISKDRAAFFGSFFKTFYGQGLISHPVSGEMLDYSRNVAMQASLKATLDCARSFFLTDFRPDLSSFKVPTLIIHGTSDQTVPIDASGRLAAKGIATSKLLEYDGAPHGLFATHKEQLTRDLLDFLQSHVQAG
jgi:non-heme chloroperoxidase